MKVGFVRSETFFWESASQKSNTDAIIARVHQHFGRTVPVDIVGLEDDAGAELVSLAQLKLELEAAHILAFQSTIGT